MRTCRDLVVDGVVRVWRPDRDELLAIKRGEWTYERLVEDVARHGAEADAAIRENRSPLPAGRMKPVSIRCAASSPTWPRKEPHERDQQDRHG